LHRCQRNLITQTAPPPSKEEILQQLSRLKNHTTLEEDRIQGEVLKNLDEGTIKKIKSIKESI